MAGGVHWLYVLPEWRNAPGLRIRLKRWTPGDHGPVSLRFRRAAAGQPYDLLRLGADGDETIELFRARRRRDGHGPADQRIAYPRLLTAIRWTELLVELADDDAAVTVSATAGGQIFRWTATADDRRSGRIAFVGLSAAEAVNGHVGARFPSEGNDALGTTPSAGVE